MNAISALGLTSRGHPARRAGIALLAAWAVVGTFVAALVAQRRPSVT